MAENSLELTVKQGASANVNWIIKNWRNNHRIVVATGSSCHIAVGNPEVLLRFFLRPKEKLWVPNQNYRPVLYKWYSLCAEVLTQVFEKAAIKVDINSSGIRKQGTIPLHKMKGEVVEVVDPFIYFEWSYLDLDVGLLCAPDGSGLINGRNVNDVNSGLLPAPYMEGLLNGKPVTDVTISINAQLFYLIENGKEVGELKKDVEESSLPEAEASLIQDLKNLFVAHDNYFDLKLESKDHMTLDAHKFILAARSRYLQKSIDDAMKMENFNGTMKMNINGKPLVVILHWMYTGELHDNSGNVLEEVVDAAILFELTHLMKLLDRKLITICNKENMFRLYQVAQKNAMPNAMEEISVYIRENL